MSANCDILHPFFKTKCILMRNHSGRTHQDSREQFWVNQKIDTTPELLIELFRGAAERIEY